MKTNKKPMHHLSLVLKQNVLSVFAILALFLAACGGDSGSSGGGGSSTGTTGTTGTTGGTTGPISTIPAVNLKVKQLTILDDTTTDGTRKSPSHALMFDITTDTDQTEDVRIDFVLVKDGDTAPTTLSDMRTLRTFTNEDASTSQVSMAYTSILKPNETTSLFLGHDSLGAYPLLANTRYTLYASQVNTMDTAVTNLGGFRTGTLVDPITYPTPVPQTAEAPVPGDFGGKLYKKPFQFMVLITVQGGTRGVIQAFNNLDVAIQSGIVAAADTLCAYITRTAAVPIVNAFAFHCEYSESIDWSYTNGTATKRSGFTLNPIPAD